MNYSTHYIQINKIHNAEYEKEKKSNSKMYLCSQETAT